MVFQDPFGSLDPKHRIRSVVSEPLALVEGVSSAERDAKAAEALTDVGLDPDDLDKYPHEFSGGQRQRIAIARALITRPSLIVADEPVSALDVSVQAQVLNLMMDLQERFDLTYVIISHDLSVVRHVTDRLAVMRSGMIVEQGETGQVFDSPRHDYTRELLASALDARPAETVEKDESEAVENEGTTSEEGTDDKVIEVRIKDKTIEPASLAQAFDKPTCEPERPKPEQSPAPPAIDTAAAVRAADAAIATAIASAKGHQQAAPAAFNTPIPAVETRETLDTEIETSPVVEELKEETSPSEPAQIVPLTAPPSLPSEPVPTAESPREKPLPEQPPMIEGHNLIDGHWRDASDDRLLKVIDPEPRHGFWASGAWYGRRHRPGRWVGAPCSGRSLGAPARFRARAGSFLALPSSSWRTPTTLPVWKRAMSESRFARPKPMSRRLPATLSSMGGPPTRSTGKPSPIKTATR